MCAVWAILYACYSRLFCENNEQWRVPVSGLFHSPIYACVLLLYSMSPNEPTTFDDKVFFCVLRLKLLTSNSPVR